MGRYDLQVDDVVEELERQPEGEEVVAEGSLLRRPLLRLSDGVTERGTLSAVANHGLLRAFTPRPSNRLIH